MSVEQLGSIAGIVLSLTLAYLPKVRDWYNAKDASGKAQTMAVLLVASALGVYGLSCANLYFLVACTVEGAKDLAGILISALIANQASFLLLVKPYRTTGNGQ